LHLPSLLPYTTLFRSLHAFGPWHVFCLDRPRSLSMPLSLGIAFLPSRRHPIVYHLRMPSISYRTRFRKLAACALALAFAIAASEDRKSTRLNSSHGSI